MLLFDITRKGGKYQNLKKKSLVTRDHRSGRMVSAKVLTIRKYVMDIAYYKLILNNRSEHSENNVSYIIVVRVNIAEVII